MSREPHPIITQLRAAREAAGLSRPHIADRAGLVTRSIERWEWGTQSPTLDTLTQYAHALGLDLALTPRAVPPPDDGEITCACGCGRTGPHKGRGLVSTCYSRAYRNGRLDDYPPQPVPLEKLQERGVRHLTAALVAARQARMEDYVWLRSEGVTRREAEQRLGVCRRTVGRWHRRLRASGASHDWLPILPDHHRTGRGETTAA